MNKRTIKFKLKLLQDGFDNLSLRLNELERRGAPVVTEHQSDWIFPAKFTPEEIARAKECQEPGRIEPGDNAGWDACERTKAPQ